MSSCYHFVSTIPPLSSGQDTLNLMGDTERIIVMSLQPRDVQTPIFPLICVVTSAEHLSGAMTGLFFSSQKVWKSLCNINHTISLCFNYCQRFKVRPISQDQ